MSSLIRKILICTLAIAVLIPMSHLKADVTLSIGPTTIPRGNATGANDITITNELFAIAIAVDTAPPWGVARGGIVDIAPIQDGVPGYDIASLADFMPNRWSSWPTTYQKVSVEKQSRTEVIIKTVRDWGDVDLETTFHVRDGDSKIRINTRMTNNGEGVLEDLYSGYVVWPDGGHLFGMPGIPSVPVTPEDAALGDWSASYGEHWVLGLHAPFSKIMAYGGRDRYAQHDLATGESRSFEAWLQIENDGTLAPLVQSEIELLQLPSGRIAGRVLSNDGEPLERSAVVVTKHGAPYAWTIGREGDYEIDLPTGNYQIYATGRGYARGAKQDVKVLANSDTRVDFNDITPPGAVHIQVTDKASGQPLDAWISKQDGYKPVIAYFGKNKFFTELDTIGETSEAIAPGTYVFEVSAGGGFTSTPTMVEVVVESGKTSKVTAQVSVLARPSERGWYGADLHHHSDVLDGFTEAEYVMRSELAAGVDITFLSDHDSVINNATMLALSDARDMHFIAGTEMSPSWAHFNAFPLDTGKTVDIDTGQATVQEIFAAARDMGADVIEANHPFSEYGYFEADSKDAIPGGFDLGFDLVEIEPYDHDRNTRTLERVWALWNDGHRAYLAGGSDAHDVWLQMSGAGRTYAYVGDDLSIEKYVAALKAGNSFASQGPLVYPEILFGSNIEHLVDDELALAYSVQAVSGLHSVQLIEGGVLKEVQMLDGESEAVQVDFVASPNADTWYSLVIEDKSGKFAYTNPVWVTVNQ